VTKHIVRVSISAVVGFILAFGAATSAGAEADGPRPPVLTVSPGAAPPEFQLLATFSGCRAPGVSQLVSRSSGVTVATSEFVSPSSHFLVPPHAPPGDYEFFVRCGSTTVTAHFVVEPVGGLAADDIGGTVASGAAVDIIGGCPNQRVAPAPEDRAAIRRAAASYASAELSWPTVSVLSAYRVGKTGTYSTLFLNEISRSCGKATARASYGVEVRKPADAIQGTASRAALVVAHFADGWRVWGRFYNS
jgi:hypothetical protein